PDPGPVATEDGPPCRVVVGDHDPSGPVAFPACHAAIVAASGPTDPRRPRLSGTVAAGGGGDGGALLHRGGAGGAGAGGPRAGGAAGRAGDPAARGRRRALRA